MEEILKKHQEEFEKAKTQMVDYMNRQIFQELLLHRDEYIGSNIDAKMKNKLLDELLQYFGDDNREEYEKCAVIVEIKKRVDDKNKIQ